MIRKRNCSIDIFRYIAALLIVALHTTPLIDISPMASYLFAQVLPRVSVPFFFIVAGYFYMGKLEKGTADPIKYIKRLLRPYMVWSVVYFAVYYIEHGGISLKYVLSKFFLYGSSYHFWFFPSLIFCVIVATFTYRIHLQFLLIPVTIMLYLIGCAGHAYYEIFKGAPLIAILMDSNKYLWYTHFFCCGPAFFIEGYLLFKTMYLWNRLDKKWSTICVIGAFVLYIAEVLLLKITDIAMTITITGSLYILMYFGVLFLLKHPLSQNVKTAEFCRKMSNYTYYSHVLFVIICSSLYSRLCGGTIGATKVFLCVVVCTFVTGVFFIHRKSRLTKMLIE